MSIVLSADHKDALQEFMNISMGRAASKLATLLNLHVTISVPNIRVATEEDMRHPFWGEFKRSMSTD
ncbi:chemotaxis protein CheC [Vibrio cholerae]|nr:chemotaxis protein CheC [Vibrio cholerae]